MGTLRFYSKLLLFGEYSIVNGGHGLAVPFRQYGGEFSFTGNNEKVSSKLRLNNLYKYINSSGILGKVLDLKSFKDDIQKGMYFNSNIPIGHGIGSSGALCAAIYYKYAFDFERKEKYQQDELKYLLDMMSLLESFYHGSSSGLDCLISLIDQPLYIKGRKSVEVCDTFSIQPSLNIYLIDSKLERKTAPLVHDFLGKLEKSTEFKKRFQQFKQLSNTIIQKCLNEENVDVSSTLAELSKWEYLNFSHMIPENMKEFWFSGIESKKYYTKFCGAGGGGFFLVFSEETLSIPGLIKVDVNELR